MDNAETILEAHNLSVHRAGVKVLDVARLSLVEGEVLSLIGPNGAGKTTLLVTLCRLFKHFSGTIVFRGKIVGDEIPPGEYRRRFAMVFQEPLLFNTTVFENVAAGLKFRNTPRDQVEKAVEENLERFGISHLRGRSAKTLSGGEAQRTSLARAFAVHPDILFLDEPFSALDPPTRESLIGDLERVIRQSRTTTVFATHDRMEALRLSDRIAVMYSGSIIQIGTPEEVMNYPVDEVVASFVGIETILRGNVVSRKTGTSVVSVAGREIEVVGDYEPGTNVILCIRPENITLSVDPAGQVTSARNAFHGRITRIVPMGFFQKVSLDCGFPLVAYVTHDSVRVLSLREDAGVVASFKATAIHVIKR